MIKTPEPDGDGQLLPQRWDPSQQKETLHKFLTRVMGGVSGVNINGETSFHLGRSDGFHVLKDP